MPTLDQHQSTNFVKLLYIGDSGTGKTGSMVSLLKDGYKFKILDMDNGLGTLVQYAKSEAPDKLGNVEFETYRDKFKSTANGPIVPSPKAFVDAMNKLQEWSATEDDQTILVVDSLSALGKAAMYWAIGMNPTSKDPRQWYGTAQSALENTVAMLSSKELKMNVIIISHVNYKEVVEGVTKGHVNAIGTALGPVIPRYFDTLLLAESTGVGKATRRTIRTMPNGIVDLKTPVSMKVDVELPLKDGLSTLFKLLKNQ